ncbi:MAG: hypothetical protein NC308_11740 [Clostridium sp.]|nr:hypothetical protein [Bacteroides sp.]MCM1199550.1 hypothetical protein [Clostridium sp.]
MKTFLKSLAIMLLPLLMMGCNKEAEQHTYTQQEFDDFISSHYGKFLSLYEGRQPGTPPDASSPYDRIVYYVFSDGPTQVYNELRCVGEEPTYYKITDEKYIDIFFQVEDGNLRTNLLGRNYTGKIFSISHDTCKFGDDYYLYTFSVMDDAEIISQLQNGTEATDEEIEKIMYDYLYND